jgi:hypothetical protein
LSGLAMPSQSSETIGSRLDHSCGSLMCSFGLDEGVFTGANAQKTGTVLLGMDGWRAVI